MGKGCALIKANPHHGVSLKMSYPKQVPLFINGEWRQSASSQLIPVTNPATQEVLTQVPNATKAEVDEAVQSAAIAFESWKNTPVGTRARVMLNYQQLLKDHQKELEN